MSSQTTTLRFVIPSSDETLRCSQCTEEVPVLVHLPVTGDTTWVGLCRTCVEQILIGFFRAEARGYATDDEITRRPV